MCFLFYICCFYICCSRSIRILSFDRLSGRIAVQSVFLSFCGNTRLIGIDRFSTVRSLRVCYGGVCILVLLRFSCSSRNGAVIDLFRIGGIIILVVCRRILRIGSVFGIGGVLKDGPVFQALRLHKPGAVFRACIFYEFICAIEAVRFCELLVAVAERYTAV